jgi:GNAT superfamily N-acetyltransferase
MIFLQEASTEGQKNIRSCVNYVEWGDKLGLLQYLERELLYRNLNYGSKCLKTWLLIDSGYIVSSCETYEMECRLDNGFIGIVLGIASVFTEQRYRNHGYAERLLKLLKEESFHHGVHAMILFSDIGSKFYQKNGFQPISSLYDYVFHQQPCSTNLFSKQFLFMDEFCEKYKNIREKYISTIFNTTKSKIIIVPTVDQLQMHFERERFYYEVLKLSSSSRIVGAFEGESLIAWEANAKQNYLEILLLIGEKKEEIDSLISCALLRALELQLSQVRVWETDVYVESDIFKMAKRELREGHLPMISSNISGVDETDWKYVSRSIWV